MDIYGYGGDFNKYDCSDNNFCDNGLISPDRVPNPHAYEVGYFYQNIWTTVADLAKGEINIFNENFFRDLSAYYMEWKLLANGEVDVYKRQLYKVTGWFLQKSVLSGHP